VQAAAMSELSSVRGTGEERGKLQTDVFLYWRQPGGCRARHARALTDPDTQVTVTRASVPGPNRQRPSAADWRRDLLDRNCTCRTVGTQLTAARDLPFKDDVDNTAW